MTGIQLILSKDLFGAHVWGDMSSSPVIAFRPSAGDFGEPTRSTVIPACVVTQAESRGDTQPDICVN